jgi:uncharacterized delta-60 repeat protein
MKTRIRPRVEALEGRTLLSAGDLDLTFGGTGKVVIDVGVQGSSTSAVVVQPADLKVVVAGHAMGASRNSTIQEIALVRYNPDGSLDPSFGSGGKSLTPASEWANGPTAKMALQADGKIVVAITAIVPQKGKTTTVNDAWEILRFNPNGSLDTTFGAGTGKVTTDFGPFVDSPHGITIEGDGKILVVGGAAYATSSSSFAVARYNANGSLDTTFGSGGKLVTAIASSDTANAVAVDTAGRIVVAGWSQTSGGHEQAAVVRYTPNGALDSSFGSGGKQVVSVPGFSDAFLTGLGLQATGTNAGKVVLSMEVMGPTDPNAPYNQLALTRLNGDGSLDPGFGANGFYIDSRMDPPSNLAQGTELAIQGDDKIVASGVGMFGDPVAHNDFYITRVLADGSSYDASYGTNGLGHADFGGGDTACALALAPDGKAVVAGSTGDTMEHLAVARFQGQAPTTTTLASSTTSVAAGQPVALTATVSTAGLSAPSGTVEFYDGTTWLGSGTLAVINGVTTATFTISTLAVGTHKVRAVYDGDAQNQGSTSADLSLVVN